ncbi:Phosphatidylglycerol/phosphatidylinositol transfer protein [Coemansia guatemalensis]|uniref:Phosphatidylglycerol/phosphatidylinositol transfer protein n=1 Tax=Coemansia guatemalensis TaxID=2761395 RepID=A0A9W8HXX4_9FUNG|nr:Phosphatidylglycerol/phosphatidylinositol transfer protein [Coemansia guatemalensis]
MRLTAYVIFALGIVQTCTALALRDPLWMIVQEATGLFANVEVQSSGNRQHTLLDGNGKNRSLNDIIRDVSEEDDLIDIKYVNLDPEKPKRSTPIHINALAMVKDHIDSATANIKVKYGFITLLNRNYDLCAELKTNLNKTCPVDEGPIEVNVDVDIPGFIPPGWFHLEATAWRDSDEKQLGRILADVKF